MCSAVFEQAKIASFVVILVSIDVMNNFLRRERSSKFVFDNSAMSPDRLSVDKTVNKSASCSWWLLPPGVAAELFSARTHLASSAPKTFSKLVHSSSGLPCLNKKLIFFLRPAFKVSCDTKLDRPVSN